MSNAQINYPLLRTAGAVTNLYAGGYDYVYVIGGDGQVTYRSLSGWNSGQVTAAVQSALDDMVGTPAPPSAGRTVQMAAPSPNPFNPRTTLTLELPPEGASVTLEVFDQRGRKVRSLLQGQVISGPRYDTVWDGRDDTGRDLASGVYFFKLQAGDQVSVQKGALVR